MSAGRSAELAALVERYAAGIEAELVLLVRLQELATGQHDATREANLDALHGAADQRDALTSELLAIDAWLRPVSERLALEPAAARMPGFAHAMSLQRTVAGLVKQVQETDRGAIGTLEEIVAVRRAAVQEAEHAEATMAAYGRRVAAPRPTATLFNRRG